MEVAKLQWLFLKKSYQAATTLLSGPSVLLPLSRDAHSRPFSPHVCGIYRKVGVHTHPFKKNGIALQGLCKGCGIAILKGSGGSGATWGGSHEIEAPIAPWRPTFRLSVVLELAASDNCDRHCVGHMMQKAAMIPDET